MTEYDNLYEALSETQNHIEQPKKDATNPMFKASYVTLDAVIDAIVKARKASGAKFFFTNVVDADKGLMITRIIGYGDTIDLVGSKIANDLGNRGTNSAQAEGSALTYARRYSLSMAFGIASDVDDDGNGAGSSNRKPTTTNTISQEKVTLLEKLIADTSQLSGQDMMAFTLKAANVSALKFVTEENYKPLLAKVTEWHKKAEEKAND